MVGRLHLTNRNNHCIFVLDFGSKLKTNYNEHNRNIQSLSYALRMH